MMRRDNNSTSHQPDRKFKHVSFQNDSIDGETKKKNVNKIKNATGSRV